MSATVANLEPASPVVIGGETEVRIHDVSEAGERPRAGVARDASDARGPSGIDRNPRATDDPSTMTPPNPPPSRDHNVDRTIESKGVSEHRAIVSQVCNSCKLTNEESRLAAAVSGRPLGPFNDEVVTSHRCLRMKLGPNPARTCREPTRGSA